MTRPVAFAVSLGLLTLIALASPLPDRVTDRDVYEATAAQRIVPDCADLHCFRVLVPWMLGPLPGSSIAKWKSYAVLCNAAAAIAVLAFCAPLGLGPRAATMAAIASLVGFGSLYTLHDTYTSDPLMFLLGPTIAYAGLTGRLALATVASVVGVFAKEFAAAPLYLASAYYAVERRVDAALRTLAGANLAFIAWVALTLTLMLRFNYSWGGTDSANFQSGAGIGPWLQRMSPRGAAAAMFNEFGALWILAPAGFVKAPRILRMLAIVSLPIAAVFAFVQQPDRALWNFHFLVTPLAAVVLAAVPTALAAATLIAFGVGNLRVGAQLPIALVGRVALASSVVLALGSIWIAWRSPVRTAWSVQGS